MRIYDCIEKKRNGRILSKSEINYIINGYVNNTIPDYQISALLMAIYFKGMTDREINNLTEAIINSGDTIDLSKINGTTYDKHSTGGVGDKTTLIVAPIIASLGGYMAKMSGKGLGFTGGTIDKLNSIPGFNTNLENNRFYKQVEEIKIALISQTGNLTPGDKKLYALRDSTATVESIPLIASSVMSKKIAAGADCILLDVKVGSGAFMKDLKEARTLATKMVNIGNCFNKKVMALITNMDQPLGYNIGNSLEVIEAIEVLKNKGPKDLKDLCIAISSHLLSIGLDKKYEECEKLVNKALESGLALDKLKELIIAQDGDPKIINNYNLFKKANNIVKVYSIKSGYINKIDSAIIGKSSCLLGAGRTMLTDTIDYSAGIILNNKINDFVNVGDVIATLYTDQYNNLEDIIDLVLSAYTITNDKVKDPVLIYEIIK